MTRAAFITSVILTSISQQAAIAAEAENKEPSVVVNGMRNPELKPYRVMLAGLDAFDEYHALAPTVAEARFKLRPKNGLTLVEMEDVSIRVASDTTSIALPLAPDGSFTLPRSQQAEDENADLLLNKKKGNYRWQADIHSEGVPAGMRRLGDLRLECQIVVAVVKKEIGFFLNMTVNAFMGSTNWCKINKFEMNTASHRAIKSATLIDGEKRVNLKLDSDGKGFVAPVGDTSYSDNTLIELKFVEE
jgi:hypothetical protein